MTTKLLTALLLGTSILGSAGVAYAGDVTLTIESWRGDDLAIWQDKIIPAFEAKHPDIKVVFAPTAPTEYNAALERQARRPARAGDLITCRPFDASLALFKKGKLADLTGAAGHGEFLPTSPRSPGQTDDGKATLLRADGLGDPRLHLQQGRLRQARHHRPPTTMRRVLRRPRQDQGRRHLHPARHRHPRPVGSRDDGLPEHRAELLEGRGRPQGADRRHPEADRPAVGRAVCGTGQVEALSRRRLRGADLSGQPEPVPLGRAAIYPAGSWEITGFEQNPDLQDGRLPAAGRRRPATSATSPTMPTSRMGLNAASEEPGRRQDVPDLGRLAGVRRPLRQRAAGLLPALERHAGRRWRIRWPSEFVAWRGRVQVDDPLDLPDPVRGTPNLENETWTESANVINGTDTPEAAGQEAAGRPRQLVQAAAPM